MIDGVTAKLSDLLALQCYAQSIRYRLHSYTTRLGNHRSKLRGRGMDFTEARNYQAGDEVRHMEWRVTARTGRPHVKVYQEEKERPVVILTDFSPSMYFGTRTAFKSLVATRLASILAWTAVKQGDRVGGLIFSARSHHEFMPRGRQAGILPLLAALSRYTNEFALYNDYISDSQSLNHALLRLRRVAKPGSIVVILSDFYHVDVESEQHLSRLRRHNDVLAYHICDPLELAPPSPQQYAMTNGQEELLLDTTLDAVRFGYQFYWEHHLSALRGQFKRLQVQYTQVTADTDLACLVQQTFPWRSGG